MSLYDIDIASLDGSPDLLAGQAGKLSLLVNVASQCGLTPQYQGLQALQDKYEARGFTVVGFPCNQFLAQEPGSPDEIKSFCETSYGVTFPLSEKVEVNGEGAHELFAALTSVPDTDGKGGDVAWNFEKFLVSPAGEVLARFRPMVVPADEGLVAAIEANLPA